MGPFRPKNVGQLFEVVHEYGRQAHDTFRIHKKKGQIVAQCVFAYFLAPPPPPAYRLITVGHTNIATCVRCKRSPYHYVAECQDLVRLAREWSTWLTEGKVAFLRALAAQNEKHQAILALHQQKRKEHDLAVEEASTVIRDARQTQEVVVDRAVVKRVRRRYVDDA